MSPLEALEAARAAGVEVRLDGEDLIVSAANDPPDDICAMLSRHKPAIVELLQAAPADAAAALARRAQFKKHAAAVAALRRPADDWTVEDWRSRFNERAAIAEHNGGLSRAAAETLAFNDCVSEQLYLNPVDSDANDGCVVCGDADRANDPLLAAGLGGGLVWAHKVCAPTWRASRIAGVVKVLKEMGLPVAHAKEGAQ